MLSNLKGLTDSMRTNELQSDHKLCNNALMHLKHEGTAIKSIDDMINQESSTWKSNLIKMHIAIK